MFAQMSMLNARDSEQQDKVAAAKAEREAKKQQKMEQMRAMMAAPAPAPLPEPEPEPEPEPAAQEDGADQEGPNWPWAELENDDQPGEFYYYNYETEETVWDKPPGWKDVETTAAAAPTPPPRPPGEEPAQEPAVVLRPESEWVEFLDDEGQGYFFNETTQETVWEMPSEGVRDSERLPDSQLHAS